MCPPTRPPTLADPSAVRGGGGGGAQLEAPTRRAPSTRPATAKIGRPTDETSDRCSGGGGIRTSAAAAQTARVGAAAGQRRGSGWAATSHGFRRPHLRQTNGVFNAGRISLYQTDRSLIRGESRTEERMGSASRARLAAPGSRLTVADSRATTSPRATAVAS